VKNVEYERSAKVPDWRYRYETDGVTTSLFSCEWISGDPEASDDIDELAWFSQSDVERMLQSAEITPEHASLFQFLLEKYHF
jgi:hypothetical protein